MSRTRFSTLALMVVALLSATLSLGSLSPAGATADPTPQPGRSAAVLEAPTNLRTASTGFNDLVRLEWDAVRGAEKYNIYVDGTYDTTVSRTSHVYPYVTATYSVVAVDVRLNSFGDRFDRYSVHSESLDVSKPLPLDGKPAAPTGLRYHRFADSLNGVLQWDPVQGIEKYNVYVDGEYDRTVTSEYALYRWETATYTVVAVKDVTPIEFSLESQPLKVVADDIGVPGCGVNGFCP